MQPQKLENEYTKNVIIFRNIMEETETVFPLKDLEQVVINGVWLDIKGETIIRYCFPDKIKSVKFVQSD